MIFHLLTTPMAVVFLFDDCFLMVKGFEMTFAKDVVQQRDGVLFVKGLLIASLHVVPFLFLVVLFLPVGQHDEVDYGFCPSV
jgi:hypothetical protein